MLGDLIALLLVNVVSLIMAGKTTLSLDLVIFM